MKWYSYLICVLLIFAGIFSIVNLVPVWNQKSASYGVIESIETQNNYSEILKVDYGVINFETTDNVNYMLKQSYKAVNFDGENNNYALLFNDNIIYDIDIHPGYIEGVYQRNFYNTDKNLICTFNMNINIQFLDNQTEITLSAKDENNSMSYFYRYMITNGAILKIIYKGVAYE